jgi:hypothetical protein
MIAEPTTTTYSDAALQEYVEAYPIPDSLKYPPTSSSWTPTYDLHAAAVDLWDEKAAAVSSQHDYTADGASYSKDQVYQHCLAMSRYHAARRRAQNRLMVQDLPEDASI